MKSHASMNRIYRLVFNAALGIWVAVAENAKGRGKGGRAASALLAVLAVLSPAAHAASAADATRTGGAGTVTTVGNTTTINQTSQRLALDWTQLSTVAGEALSFVQPNAQAIALNRITGASASSFLGSLTANGQVFILNPNGILFGAGSQVNVGGIVASTLGMNPTDFMNGSNTFTRTSGRGSVVNQGSMTAAQGGYLAMLAPEVRNEGVMTASLGTALLAAGNKVTLNLDNGSLLGYSIDQGAINALAENKQLIKADGGQVLLSAKALDALTTATVNNTGVIEARTLQNIAGRIMLMGDMEHGIVNVGGTLDASAPTGGNGGFIETSAAHVKVATGTRVTTLAASGQTGKWLIDPNDFTIAATGGDMDATTVVGNLATTNFEIQTATMGSAGLGDIHVNEALTWTSANTLTLTAQRNININQAITATNGGLTLNSTSNGLISAPAAVNVGTFDLVNGKWEQLSGSLPAFSATDFRISGGTFIRALGGDGLSAVTAYQLTDVYGLQGAGSDGMLNKHYKLANDIDATGTALWNGGVGGAGFKPIGDGANNYTGTFDGDSKTISNLTINRPAEYSVGLIGHLGGSGTVMNVGLTNVSATGDTHVGGLAGANDGQISNSYVTGSVTGNYNVGGLVGNNNFGDVSNSYATGAVTGLDSVGGLIGSNNYGAISNSYASGAVTSIELGGGLVGINAGTISDSYATGSVTGTSFLGGLVGAYFSGTIINSYATGSVTGTSFLGGLVGFNIGGTVSNSFWNINTTGQATSGGGTGMTTAQMKQASTFTNWSIATTGGSSNVWRIYEGNTGPLLRSFLTAFHLTPDFDGSANNPANIGAYSAVGADPTKLLGAAATASDKLTLSNTGTAGEYTATVAAGRYSHQQGYDLVTHRVITTAGSAAGDVQLGNNISYTSGTLELNATGNVDMNNKVISGISGTQPTTAALQINSGSVINQGAVNVDTFRMAGGTWQQVGGTPAAFAARDFGISGGTFIRALGGDGLSAGTAYQLTDVYGLQGAGSAGMLNKNYKLANNIDASGTALWNGSAGFKQIGGGVTDYTGTFDGNNKTISNLTINRPAENNVGLFASLLGSTIMNLGLTSFSVTGKDFVGGLAGTNSAGQINNSYGTGSVTGSSSVGGLVGTNFGTINNSYATGSVTGSAFAGGLVGANAGTVSNSFWNTDTTGQATSAGGTGKTTGEMMQAATFTSAGWSASNVGGENKTWRIYEGQTGPLLRSFLTPLNMDLAYDGNGAALTQAGAYSTPGTADTTKLFGTAAAPGTLTLASSGVAGNYLASAPVSGLFSQQNGYDILPTASRTIASAGSAAGDVQLGNDISFTNGTLAVSAANNINLNGKAITTGSGTLQINGGTAINAGAVNVDTFNLAGGTWQQVGSTPAAFAVRDFGISGGTFIRALGGDGLSAGTAYQLTDVYGLQGAGSAGMLNKNYKLANNIDASGTALWNGGVGGAGFDPIGDNTTRFTGTFDGNNKTVSNLTINRPGQDYVGLMGDLGTGGTVTNVGLVNVSVDGLFYVGGIAGNSGGTISNSYATGRVEGQGEAGGLVGVNSGAGQISNSYVTSSVSGYSYVGGLVGTNSGTISESYATGSVTGNDRVGGLVGTNWGAGQISNSYATGSVSGNDYVGGLVSINDATISNSYATGSVGGIGHVGGLVGINYETISNSFWNTQTSGQTTSAGGTGMTTVEMMQAATFTSAGWSASNVGGDGTTWRIYEGNSGPLLRGLMTGLTLANTTVTYNGGTQQGATTADARVLGGSNASGRNFGSYANSYYSNQQGVDIIGGSLAVNKANLVLSTSNVTKTYDGDRSALGTAIVTASTALLGGDTATGGSFAFINKNAGTGNKAVSTTGVNVNDGNSGNNYSVSYANNTTSTITPKALTVLGMTAGNKVYDRTDSATVNTGSASYSGLVSGDLLAVNATGTFTDKNVANGKTVSLTSSYTGADVNNYIITSQATTTANITPKALTVSGITAANKIYDQGMSATVSTTGAVLGGFIAGDVLAVNATGVFLDKNAATGKTVNLTSSYTGADVGNYTITDQSTTVASITPKVLTVSGVTASNKTYDQTTAATVSTAGAVLGGLIAGDVLAVNATGMFTDKNAATLKTVNLTSNYTGADAGNYAITNQASTTANITPKSLTVSGATAQNKVYDATTAATITFSDNRIAGDVLGFTSAANFSDKNVGTAKTVNYSGVAATGVDAGNYTLSATSGVSSANITRAPLNITANNDGRLAGAPYSGGNGVVYSGLVGGETASVLTGALAFSGNSQGASTAGSYAITPGGQAGSNYAIAFNNGVLTLTPAPVPAPAAPVSAIANALRKFTPDIAGFDPEESFSAAKNSVQTSFKVDGGSGGSGGGSGGSGGGAGGANTPEGKLNAAANGDAGDAADEN